MLKNRLLIGGGCLLLAGSITIITIYGGGEEEETCLDESPIGFYDEHLKNHPLKGCEITNIDYKTLKEDAVIYTSCKVLTENDDSLYNDICSSYISSWNSTHSDQLTQEEFDSSLVWYYPMAYSEYYGMNKKYGVKEKNHINYIFDSSINCFAGKNQIYIHPTDGINYREKPTFVLNKSLSEVDYFGLFLSASSFAMDLEIDFSIIKKVADKKYESHNFIFDATITPGNGMTPPFIAVYFDSFVGFDNSLISSSNMIAVSYKIKNPAPEAIDHEIDFIKLYEVLLPNSKWN